MNTLVLLPLRFHPPLRLLSVFFILPRIFLAARTKKGPTDKKDWESVHTGAFSGDKALSHKPLIAQGVKPEFNVLSNHQKVLLLLYLSSGHKKRRGEAENRTHVYLLYLLFIFFF